MRPACHPPPPPGTGVPEFRQVELRNASSLPAKAGSVLAFLSSGRWN
jgi:hypothetical protein